MRLLTLATLILAAASSATDKENALLEAEQHVQEHQWAKALKLLESVGRLPKKSPKRALHQTLIGQSQAGLGLRREAAASFRQAVKLRPKDPANKLRLGWHLLAELRGCPIGVPDGLAEAGEEVREMMGKVLRSKLHSKLLPLSPQQFSSMCLGRLTSWIRRSFFAALTISSATSIIVPSSWARIGRAAQAARQSKILNSHSRVGT